MANLVKVENDLFKEYYEGVNGSIKVTCILDDHCVRYTVLSYKGKWGGPKCLGKHTYKDNNKATCFQRAEEALNKMYW